MTDSSLVNLLSAEVVSLVRQSYLKSFWVVPGMSTEFISSIRAFGKLLTDINLALALSAQILAILPMISTTEKYSI